MRLIRPLLFLTLLICLLPVARPAKSSPTKFTSWLFVVVETAVHPSADEDAPQERRFYMSNVITMPENIPSYSLVKKVFSPYFSTNVMDPAEKRGIAIDYSEQDMKLNGEVSAADYATREEAESQRNKEIEYRKNQSGNIYSFEIDLKSPKGEETSKPKLIHRDKGPLHYEKAK
jgi:hypothetical protein